MSDMSTRRQLLAAASAGTVLSFTATSYARIVGANERISIGLIGCGGRGYGRHNPGAAFTGFSGGSLKRGEP